MPGRSALKPRRARGVAPARDRRPRMFGHPAWIALLAAGLPACDSDARPEAGATVVTDTVGDTVVVRTLSGGVWEGVAELVPELSIGQGAEGPEEQLFGRIASLAADPEGNVYVLDGQAQELRVFDDRGGYVTTLARRGGGPGELAGADAIALLPDRRVAVRDPANARVQMLGPEPGQSAEWRYEATTPLAYTPLWADGRGRIYLIARDPARAADRGEHVVVLGPRGEQLRTFAPDAGFAPAVLEARRTEGRIASVTSMAVPFSPALSWAVHPTGAVLVGISADYRIEVRLGDGVRRIERAYEPVPVTEAERDYEREFIERNMRNFQADWTWEGPPIPNAKPPFKALHPGQDGRIWVELSMPPRSESELWLGERRRYDVFEFDGTYLGAVDAPADLARHPPAVFGADHVWAVARDELRIERVVRYRIERRPEVGG